MSDYQQGVPISITDTFRVNGVETNPTTILYSILGPDGTITTYTWPADLEITNPGVGQFVLAIPPPSLPGLYTYDVDATGTVVASRVGSFNVLANYVTGPDVPWPVPGPCAPWTSSQAAWDCCGQPTTTVDGDVCPVDFAAQVQMASEVLFELSGRLYSGACEQTVRPCRTGCQCGIQVLSRGHIIGPWDFGWAWGGSSWICDDDPCGCWPTSKVLLPGYPVREILEVKIDGDVVDPDTYELQNWRWLVRVRDPAEPDVALQWPSCQALDLPDTADGTFSVTYRYGQDPPVIGQHAAAALACEMYRACSGGDGECAIPANAVRVTRQGVTIDKNATIGWMFSKDERGGWITGITLVDSFLNSFNRSGMTQRPKTWSPDGNKFAKKAGVSFGRRNLNRLYTLTVQPEGPTGRALEVIAAEIIELAREKAHKFNPQLLNNNPEILDTIQATRRGGDIAIGIRPDKDKESGKFAYFLAKKERSERNWLTPAAEEVMLKHGAVHGFGKRS